MFTNNSRAIIFTKKASDGNVSMANRRIFQDLAFTSKYVLYYLVKADFYWLF